MRNHLRLIFGAICFCFLAQSGFAEEGNQPQLVEKGSKAKSKSEIKIFGFLGNQSGCRGATGAKGPTGPMGPTGARGPDGTGFTDAYAAAFQLEEVNLGEKFIDEIIRLPFSTLDYSKNITLDAGTDTFTLPKGIYIVDFQFMIDDDSKYAFNKMYFTIDGSELNVAWAPGRYEPDENDVADNSLASFSGSTIFEAPEDETEVRFFMRINRKDGNPDFIFTDPNATFNYPTRIVFRKIAEVCG
jgi:hypothetical protein